VKPVSGSAQVQALDRATIDAGIAGRTLMEIAGQCAAQAIRERFSPRSVAVLCGPGNNGGDGYVVARALATTGYDVRVWAAATPTTDDAKANRALCERLSIPIVGEIGTVDLKVDALLGTGQRDAPRGAIAAGVKALHGKAPVVALDLPTGVHADTGQALGEPARAALTVTFGRWKTGLLAEPGASLAGEVVLVDIGLDLGARMAGIEPDAWLLENSDVVEMLGGLRSGDAKWDRGHVAVRAGGGAAVLACHGAFRMGAGLVTLLASEKDWPRIHGLWPEVILAKPEALDPNRHDAVVVGPGLGDAKDVAALWRDFPGPVVADADALGVVAAPPADRVRVVTPHAGEAGRMLGMSRTDVAADRFSAVRALERFGTPVLKGPWTLIGGGAPWINPTGTDRLATAGSGDVLAGMVGALLARGLGSREAAAAAVWLHGVAGRRMPDRGSASDLVEALRDWRVS
jgi:ADP-dependent NAD(P)H-hydrate dehydratase / NAD(P)H-hydrate epimerase